jgi:hypothetical protein
LPPAAGKFLSRLDLDVRGGEVKDYRFKLIPDVRRCDRAGRRDGHENRRDLQPPQKMLREVVGRTETQKKREVAPHEAGHAAWWQIKDLPEAEATLPGSRCRGAGGGSAGAFMAARERKPEDTKAAHAHDAVPTV